MLKISNDILTNKDNNESTGLICIDLSAYHISKSYLTGRSQRVLIDDVRSDKKQLRQGVPQGSVLGARLYTLYVRPLPDVIQRHSYIISHICRRYTNICEVQHKLPYKYANGSMSIRALYC